MKPEVHARLSVKRYGGKVEDYLPIHDFFDCTKMALPDVRHRMMLHNSVGCFIAERVFGHNIVNSDKKSVSVRDIAENHIIEDLGFIPSLERCFAGMKVEAWMGGKVSKYAADSAPQPVFIQEEPNPNSTGHPPPAIPTSISGVVGFTDTSLIPRNNSEQIEPSISNMVFDGVRPVITNGEKNYD